MQHLYKSLGVKSLGSLSRLIMGIDMCTFTKEIRLIMEENDPPCSQNRNIILMLAQEPSLKKFFSEKPAFLLLSLF